VFKNNNLNLNSINNEIDNYLKNKNNIFLNENKYSKYSNYNSRSTDEENNNEFNNLNNSLQDNSVNNTNFK